jgi:Fur family ferric uptake transcriptional regulator
MKKSATAVLDAHGLRKTDIRLKVVDRLRASQVAMSQPDLELEFQHETDRVTIYRTLHTLEEKGVIHRIIDLAGVSRYALCDETCDSHQHTDEHMHFHCLQCGNIYCLDIPALPSYPLPVGYNLQNIRLSAEGTCPSCN